MEHADLAKFARASIEPTVDTLGLRTYRCSARLKDDLLLPCVLLASAEGRIALARRRLSETAKENQEWPFIGKPKFRGWTNDDILGVFVANGNSVNHYDIQSVEPSPFAIPLRHLRNIGGEHSMGWTRFGARMVDGNEFFFGTSFHTEFFDMPQGYTTTDIAQITSGAEGAPVLRERPFFVCYVVGL